MTYEQMYSAQVQSRKL